MTLSREKGNGAPELVLLKSARRLKRARRNKEAAIERPPVLRLIDCRPNLFGMLRSGLVRRPLREVVERMLGRFAAAVSAKLRR